ncbi:amidohydrolase family protein [Paraburkholderia xenovorans]|uniref:amidohydrolase family protein n=1 Tax=Paraburkholderia xenovorans TaxID=36873 RepID=UPI0020A6C52C|nr:amidohydrolase family protein [Paraburkholderia xenovorans]
MPLSRYRRLQARLGTARNVIIQPSSYGVDNTLLVVAIAQFAGRARGVAVVNTSVTDIELKDLHEAGVRGIRFNLNPPGTTTLDMLMPLAPMGWHVQASAPAADLLEAGATWSNLPCPVVFDHLATVPEQEGAHHPCFQMVSELLVAKKAYVKLTGFYVTSRIGAPSYGDSVEVARAFARIAPDRVVWGSDWPYPSEQPKNVIPDDALLLDLMSTIVPDEAMRNRIFVDTPARLYGFA